MHQQLVSQPLLSLEEDDTTAVNKHFSSFVVGLRRHCMLNVYFPGKIFLIIQHPPTEKFILWYRNNDEDLSGGRGKVCCYHVIYL